MKYNLETIPVRDAFEADSECPFCLLEQKAEEGYLKYYLGSSVMAPETRVTVNARGFCRAHWSALGRIRGERHALSLLAHTRFTEAAFQTEKILEKIGQYDKKRLESAITELESQVSGCVICERLEATMKRYYFTVVHLWKTDDQGFRKRYRESRGVCLRHLGGLVAMASETLCSGLKNLGGKAREDWKSWIRETLVMEQDSFHRLEGELFDYSRSFDPQYERKDLNYRDESLDEGIEKLTGKDFRP
ncbi:DUF6062 family protein [Marispirochaeta aestuarii]|uniref:DUF6062 family protein n=1 Tax=Marispirochaeta aestuarii TaxID=1963862 RepID=UPI0029C9701A|nr:DUF6062 family protein [Marispirochaeta aestuarii]